MGSFFGKISMGIFELLHKILNPYTAKYAFYRLLLLCVISDIYELWDYKPWSYDPMTVR